MPVVGSKAGPVAPVTPKKSPACLSGSGVTIESGGWSGSRVALIEEKEKQFILYDRPADAAAVGIPVLHRLRTRAVVKKPLELNAVF